MRCRLLMTNLKFSQVFQLVLGCIVLALVIFVCVQLHTRLAIVALLCLLTIVVISLQGRFFVALLCSVLATLGLDYFFTQPVFSLVVTRPDDIAALFTFLTIALVVSALGSKVRKSEEELRRSQAYLAEAESLSKSGTWALKPATKETIYWSQ